MKTRLGLAFLILAALTYAGVAKAQQMMHPYGGMGMGPSGVQPMVADFQVGMPGRMWIQSNIADRGLGYEGSYFTLGGKTHLFQDRLDGRWLGEFRAHYAYESEGFFGNFGIERVISIAPAGADVSLGGWFDYDDSAEGDFVHTFTQAGVSGSIKSRRWDLVGNGYFPLGTTDYALGDPTGQNCFLNHSIVLIPGIDSALNGFDVTFRMRPRALGMVNGSIDLGGYGYRSDLVDFFGGGRIRLAMQLLRGLVINAEVNQDERFDTTGVLQLGYIFGVNARGNEYSLGGRDLEPTLRNDHIVRFQQDLVLAIDPDTGAPYNVYHVDNTADVTIGDGRFETPYTTLLNAQNASSTDAIIFVHRGDGTTRGMDSGIVLKDRQMLLGNGVQHIIPIQGGQNFILCNDLSGNRPRISGKNNGNAVTLADDNVVRGFIIDGSAGGMANGIFGDGVLAGAPIDNGVIEDVEIFGAILHGVFVNDLSGDWNFARNDIHDNGFDGILLTNACDPTSIFNFEDNDVSRNGRDGIHMVDWDAASLTFTRNFTDLNGRDGVRLENFKNGSGDGATVRFLSHSADSNQGNGINIIGGDGDLRFLNSLITNNLGDGIRIQNWTNTNASHITWIDATSGNSTITGNGVGAGAGIHNLLEAGTQRLLITDSVVDGNGVGILSTADNIGTSLRTQIINNFSVAGNNSDGIRLESIGGASHTALIDNSTAPLGDLDMSGNGATGGNGIRLLVGDLVGTTSTMDAVIRNVNIANTTTGNGLIANVVQDGNLRLLFENSTVDSSGLDGVNLSIDTIANLAINTINLRNLQLTDNGDNGIDLVTGTDTFTDVTVINTTITNAATAGSDGFSIAAFGDDTVVGNDNRTRVFLQGSTISNYTQSGFFANAFGDASLFLELDANQIVDNGPGIDPTALPFFSGLEINGFDSSELNIRMTNNLVTRNFEQGLSLFVGGTSSANVFLGNNNFSGNDLGEDVNTVPPESFLLDFQAINGLTATTCIAMSNNFFTLPAEFTNLSFLGAFDLELDGATNNFAGGTAFTAITFPPFGTFCQPAIAAEEAAFLADGFPPR